MGIDPGDLDYNFLPISSTFPLWEIRRLGRKLRLLDHQLVVQTPKSPILGILGAQKAPMAKSSRTFGPIPNLEFSTRMVEKFI